MERTKAPFEDLLSKDRGLYHAILYLAPDTNILNFRQRVLFFLARYFNRAVELDYVWIRLPDRLCFAVTGDRCVVEAFNIYVSATQAEYLDTRYWGRSLGKFSHILSGLFSQRVHAPYIHSYGGSK
ncbi:hypothetical protein ACW582_03490 [Pseudomonas chlororaphis]